MREIKPLPPTRAAVAVPGSKSITHRVLIAAALSDGRCVIDNALESDDTRLTRGALQKWGIEVAPEGEALVVMGGQGELHACRNPIFLGNSGTSMRLLTAAAALARGKTTLTGTDRLRARPIRDLLDGLAQVGVAARSVDGSGCPPVEVEGGGIAGGRADLNCALSSQFLSALLLVGPYTRQGLEVRVTSGPVSRPYIDITLDTMASFGVRAERDGYTWFKVPGGRCYRAGRHRVEPDCSQAAYFWAAAAIAASTVSVRGTHRTSRQGDIRILDILEQMGCRVASGADGVAVSGGVLSGVDVDMADIPDVVPTVAVVAAFARGRTVIRNVAHLREKESDRLAAVTTGLNRMGVAAGCDADSLWIEGGTPQAAAIDCHSDHRIAMSFAVAGLKTPGVRILDEACVQKSFPGFWQTLEGLYR
jgi:3-phosphoshikimate 1-carboxyvinyltransferase